MAKHGQTLGCASTGETLVHVPAVPVRRVSCAFLGEESGFVQVRVKHQVASQPESMGIELISVSTFNKKQI